jgi:hypothetical protein
MHSSRSARSPTTTVRGDPPAGAPAGDPPPVKGEWWIEGLAAGELPAEAAPLDLDEYILAAAERNNRSFRRRDEDPEKQIGNRSFYQSGSLVFIGLMKSWPKLQGCDGFEAAELIDERLQAIFPDAEDPWRELGLPDHDTFDNPSEPYGEIANTWDEIQPMELEAPSLERAVELAERYPLKSNRHKNPRLRPYLRLLSICYWLDQQHQGESFPLSCRVAGEILDISHTQAAAWIRTAQKDGLLVLHTGPARKSRRPHRTAQMFRFNRQAVTGDPARSEPAIP